MFRNVQRDSWCLAEFNDTSGHCIQILITIVKRLLLYKIHWTVHRFSTWIQLVVIFLLWKRTTLETELFDFISFDSKLNSTWFQLVSNSMAKAILVWIFTTACPQFDGTYTETESIQLEFNLKDTSNFQLENYQYLQVAVHTREVSLSCSYPPWTKTQHASWHCHSTWIQLENLEKKALSGGYKNHLFFPKTKAFQACPWKCGGEPELSTWIQVEIPERGGPIMNWTSCVENSEKISGTEKWSEKLENLACTFPSKM